jgi:hypothetical protein
MLSALKAFVPILLGVLLRILRIFIRVTTGYTVPRGGNRELDQQCLSLAADENDTVLTLKSLLQQTIHITPNSQQLYFRGERIPNDATLKDCHVGMDSELHMKINFDIQIIVKLGTISSCLWKYLRLTQSGC